MLALDDLLKRCGRSTNPSPLIIILATHAQHTHTQREREEREYERGRRGRDETDEQAYEPQRERDSPRLDVPVMRGGRVVLHAGERHHRTQRADSEWRKSARQTAPRRLSCCAAPMFEYTITLIIKY